jgi:hypothetical protein
MIPFKTAIEIAKTAHVALRDLTGMVKNQNEALRLMRIQRNFCFTDECNFDADELEKMDREILAVLMGQVPVEMLLTKYLGENHDSKP